MEFRHIRKLIVQESPLDPSENPATIQSTLEKDLAPYCEYISPCHSERIVDGGYYSRDLDHRWIFRAHHGLEFSFKYHVEGQGGLFTERDPDETFEHQKAVGKISIGPTESPLIYLDLVLYLTSLGFSEFPERVPLTA